MSAPYGGLSGQPMAAGAVHGQVTTNGNSGVVASNGHPGHAGLIARDRELAHLEHILWGARRGSSGAVVFRGEPGVGKSALLEAAAGRASDFRLLQLQGAVFCGDDSVPHELPAPIAELLEQFSSSELRADVTSTQARLTEMERREDAAGAAAASLERMIHAALVPLFITIDDCQLLPVWLAVALIKAVMDQLADKPVALVMAFGDAPNVEPVDLSGTRVPEHRLGGLNFDQSSLLLRRQQLNEPTPDVLRLLVEATRGNPYALIDACSNLTEDQQSGFRSPPEPLPITEEVARPFSAGLAGLPPETVHALAMAAAARCPVKILTEALAEMGLSVEVLEPAQEAGVIVIRGDRLDFRHPLVGAAAYQRVSRTERIEAHQALSGAFFRHGLVERAALHAGRYATYPDQGVARLFGQAAQVALDRGDPREAARDNEMVAEFAEANDVAARHLALAADLWMNVGQSRRALTCVELALEREPSGPVKGEVHYQQARAHAAGGALGREVAGEMISAAALCEESNPYSAVLMLSDAAARSLLDDSDGDATGIAQRAADLSPSTSSHVKSIARAALASMRELSGRDQDAGISSAVSMLIGQTHRFTASPQLAFVIGLGLVKRGEWGQVRRWTRWIAQCAQSMGDEAMMAVPPLLDAIACLQWGSLDEAIENGETSLARSRACEDHVLAAQALAVLVDAHSARGEYAKGFECAAQLFALTADNGQSPRAQAFIGLSLLELQRGHSSSAVTWLRALDEELASRSGQKPTVRQAAVRAGWAPSIATNLLLSAHRDDVTPVLEAVEAFAWDGGPRHPWRRWVSAICTEDIDAASDQFRAAARSVKSSPLTQGRVWLCWGTCLVDAQRNDEARRRLERARDRFAGLEARGWLKLTERELSRLPALAAEAPTAAVQAGGPGVTAVLSEPKAPETVWEIHMLGLFAVRHCGKEVSLPLSLAAQGLKIVALRKRIPVDELVELLWPEAKPGVGTRRLRNVLWRIRTTCGDLLEREDNLIRLAPGAATDVESFKRLATQALDHECPRERSLVLAQDALRHYLGELLPGDRYADWTAGPRDSLRRLHIRLLELLLSSATDEDRLQEALSLVDRLIEADPYEEAYYLRAAELHSRAGSRRSAASMVTRAERMLSDLGISPSPALQDLRQSLGATTS